MSSDRTFDLPALPPRPGPIGDLARQLLLEGDLTAFRPLQDALLEEERSRDARILQQYLAQVLVPPPPNGRPPIVRNVWQEFAHRVYQLLLFDLFEPDAVLQEFERKCEETRAVTYPSPNVMRIPGTTVQMDTQDVRVDDNGTAWSLYPGRMAAARAETTALDELDRRQNG